MNDENTEYQSSRENTPTTTNESSSMELAENASKINTYLDGYNCDDFQGSQQYTEVLSSNNNNNNNDKLQSSVLDDYYTLHPDLQRQQTSPTNEHSIGSDVTFEQEGQQDVASFENEAAIMELPKVPMYSKDYCQKRRQQGQEEMTSMQEQFKRLNKYSTTVTPVYRSNPTSSSINPVCAESENSDSTFANYELCGSYSAEYNPNVQPQQQQQQANMQTESINSVLAHQWRQRREKLPITGPLYATFHTEWQINRPEVVNTAEIQKRKLQFFQRKADEQLAPVANQPNTSSTLEQTKKPRRKQKQKQQQQPQPCNSQEQQLVHQPPHFYRLHQMQQQHQNHLRSPTPDSLSSSRQFSPSPMSFNSSVGSPQQLPPQMLPYIQSALSQQIQTQQLLQPNNNNSNCNFPTVPQQQQQMMLQMLQQQQLQQQLYQYYQATMDPDFINKWQTLNQQKYQQALQENAVRHKSASSSRQLSRKRKRPNFSREIEDDKENASANSSEPPLVIDESAVKSTNVPDRFNDDLEPQPNSEDLKSELQPTHSQSGMWQNNYDMFHDWLQTQQQAQDVNQKESDAVQYGNAE